MTFKSTASVSQVTSRAWLTGSACFDEVSTWMRAKRLQVNASKTNVLYDSIRSQLHQYALAVLMCRRYPLFVTSGYISTPKSVYEHMTLPPSDRALQYYILDSECTVLSSTTRPADINPCFGCQLGRLLLFSAGRCLRSSTGQAAVHPQCSCPIRVLSQALQTHHPASP